MSSFYARRSGKRKKQLELTVFFALLGSASVKAARKMLVKFTPDNMAAGFQRTNMKGEDCEGQIMAGPKNLW